MNITPKSANDHTIAASLSAAEITGSIAATPAPRNYRLLAAAGRLYPFYSGSSQLTDSWLYNAIAKPESAYTWCRGPGGSMLVPLDDFVGRCIYFTGDYDRKISSFCRRIMRPGDTALDIGANMGVVALQLAQLAGPNGAVHAFEPNPRMASLLTQSAARNSYGNLRLHPTALGSASGTLELHIPRNNAGQGSLIYHKDLANHDVVRTSVRTLSEVVKELGIQSLRLIKIDVEGFENEVLLGGREILQTVRPDFILLEANEDTMTTFATVPAVQTLKLAGYRFLRIPRTLLSMVVVPVDVKGYGNSPSHDIVAIPEEKYGQICSELEVVN